MMPMKMSSCSRSANIIAFLSVMMFLLSLPSACYAINLSNEERAYLKAKDTVIFVSQTEYPPFEFVDANGQHEGMMLDIVRWIAVEAGFKPVFMDMTFQQAQEAVLSGKADVITSLFYSEKRKEKFEFTRPLFDVPASIFIKTDRTDIKDIKDLNGKIIAMQKGDYAKEFLEAQKSYFFTLFTRDFSEATNRVVEGQADTVIGDEQIVFYHLYSNRLTGSIKKVGEPLYVGKNCMAANQDNAILIAILNKGINEAVASGQLDKITTKWMGTAINPGKSFWDRYRWHVAACAAGLLLLLSLIWMWNFRLRVLVKNKTADITLREEALRESEERYRSILNASPDNITITDVDGRIIMVSPAALTMFGYDREEKGLGRLVTEFTVPEDRLRASSNIARKLQGAITGPAEYRGLRMDGSSFDMEVNSDFIRAADGHPTGIVFVIRDISERKLAEETLRSNRKQLTDIIDFLPDATLALDKERRVIIWNKAVEAMTGIPAADMIGKGGHAYTIPFYGEARPSLMDLIFEDHEGIGKRYQHVTRENDTFTAEAFCDALYGNKGAWVFAKVSPLYDQDGRIIGAIETIRDITKLKESEQALQKRESYFRALFENAGDAIFIEDETDRILDINNRACELLGYTREELLQMHVSDLQAPEYRGTKGNVIKEEIARSSGVPFETLDVRKDGLRVPVEVTTVHLATGDDLLALSIVRDITERKRAEADRERLKQAIEQSGETIVITDPQGIIQYVNPTFTQVTGYSFQEAIGLKTSVLKSGIDDDTFYRDLWETISNGKTWKGRMTNKRKDGSLFSEEATISPVIGPDGQIVNFVAVKLDITEKLRAEQEKLLLENQFIQAQKMEAVGQLAGGVAHDFNNMLAVIQGYAEMAIEKEKIHEPAEPNLKIILDAAKKSADIVRQLLAFARKQDISPRVIDLNATVGSISLMLRRLINEDVELSWLPGEAVWPIKMDPSQIDQILVNLCVNARDSITGVGKITIETMNSTFDEEYCAAHAGFIPGEYVRIAVSDSGCGMDNEMLTHIFEPFYTTKGIGKGTGLGLATVYGAVKQNNGFVNVYSKPGQGTTFSIYLQRYTGRDQHQQPLAATEPDLQGYETILLVEDDPTILKMATSMLHRLGYTVLAANTPGDAIQLVGELDGKIHLLLTDVVMPEMNGRVLAERLLERQPGMKHLFMSGYTANVISHHGVLDDGVCFIQKPFSFKELGEKIREALES